MTGGGGILSLPSEHIPGLVALIAVPCALWVSVGACRMLAEHDIAWARRLVGHLDRFGLDAKVTLVASLVGATVHAAIVPTHWKDERLTAVLFIVDAFAFAMVFWWAWTGRRYWRLVGGAVFSATAAAYCLALLTGQESVDIVGWLTTTVEVAAVLVLLAPVRLGSTRLRDRLVGLAAFPLALFSVLGTSAIASATTGSSVSPTRPMANMPVSTPEKPFDLTTTSPAGPITWPDRMGAMGPGMEMAAGVCTAQPTASQQRAAVQLVDETVAAVAPYRSLSAAKAAGYVPITPTGQKVVHYLNPAVYRRGQALDPGQIPVLVYVNTAHGAVLSAAMYLMDRSEGSDRPPQPGGCLTQWHIHTNLCFDTTGVVGTTAGGSCATGTVKRITPPMMHVWVTPVSGGPLAPDPSGLSQVLAAYQVPAPSPLNGPA